MTNIEVINAWIKKCQDGIRGCQMAGEEDNLAFLPDGLGCDFGDLRGAEAAFEYMISCLRGLR